MADTNAAQNAPPAAVNDAGASHPAKIGLAAAAAGTGGFVFGLFNDLHIADMIKDHSFYSFAAFGFVAVLILVTGRATLTMANDAKRIMDITIAFSIAVVAVCLVVVFLQPAQISVSARFATELSDSVNPKLVPRIVSATRNWDLTSNGQSVTVQKDGTVDIEVQHLSELFANYANALSYKAQYEALVKGGASAPPPPPPS